MFDSYFDPRAPGSFGGVDVLRREVNSKLDKNKHVKKGEVRDWLRDQPSYTLHFPVKTKFKRNRVTVYSINEQFQADLADLRAFSKENDGVNYLLTCIDIFSKYAFVIPLKDKRGKTVRDALEKIFAERRPEKFQTDQGKEFENADCFA